MPLVLDQFTNDLITEDEYYKRMWDMFVLHEPQSVDIGGVTLNVMSRSDIPNNCFYMGYPYNMRRFNV